MDVIQNAMKRMCTKLSSSGEKSMLTLTRFAPAGAGIFRKGNNSFFVLPNSCQVACEMQNVTLGSIMDQPSAGL